MTSVTIVIPHMGRENLLIETLHSIKALDTRGFELDIVVVSKNINFSEELKAFNNHLKVNFLSVEASTTISEQRNLGAKTTNSQYIGFIDADIALAADWLQQMYKLLVSDPNMAIASAKQVNSNNPPVLEQLRTALSNIDLDVEMPSLPGSNLFLSRETFAKTGGFPAHLVTCEDHIFTQRALEFGTLCRSSKSTHIHLGEDKSYWGMAKKEVWRGQSNLVSLKGRKVPMHEIPSFVAPPAFTFGVLFSVLFGMFSYWGFAALFGFGALFILALYTYRFQTNCPNTISSINVLFFYILYFPSRTIGTFKGIFHSITSDSKHD